MLYLITEENNYLLYKYPTKNETKKVDFDLKGIVLVDWMGSKTIFIRVVGTLLEMMLL